MKPSESAFSLVFESHSVFKIPKIQSKIRAGTEKKIYNVCPEKKLTKGILESNRLPGGKIMFVISNKDKELYLSKFLKKFGHGQNYHILTLKRPYQLK